MHDMIQTAGQPLALVVDDDAGMREALADLLASEGIETRCHASTTEALDDCTGGKADCLILDVNLPEMGGIELQERLNEMGADIPVIFMTGYGDVPTSVQAFKRGARDFLIKPFRDEDLLLAVREAIAEGAARREQHVAVDHAAGLVATLTPREREVMALVVRGLMNKQIAYELGIAEITVKLHRGKVMRKMKATSVAELVRQVDIATRQAA